MVYLWQLISAKEPSNWNWLKNYQAILSSNLFRTDPTRMQEMLSTTMIA